MPSSFNRNYPNMEQGRCSILRSIRGLGHEEYRFVHSNMADHTYPTMRCYHCKAEWDLDDKQMNVFVGEERLAHDKWVEEHKCKDCGHSHLGSGMNCEEWNQAGKDLIRQLLGRTQDE